jgi:hypothetical protein
LLALVIVLAATVLLLAVLVVGLLRSHAEILRRLHELGAGVYEAEEGSSKGQAGGVTSSVDLTDRPDRPDLRTQPGVPEPRSHDTPAFDLAGSTPDGSAKAVGVVGAEHSTLIAFLSSGCGTCGDSGHAFAEGEGARLPGRDTRLVIVTKDADEESPAAVAQLAPAGHVTLMSSQAFVDYGVPVSPYVILVDGPQGRVIGEGAAATWAQVANLLRQAAADAGLAVDGGASPADRRLDGPGREARADEELLRAGIAPGHPSLYPDRIVDADVTADVMPGSSGEG